jgi:hypothetical protein
VGKLHWLILFPYYFFGALTLLGVFLLFARLMRARVSINALVIAAIVLPVIAMAIPLLLGWVGIASFTGLGVAVLLLTSFIFAAIDAIVCRSFPLPLDEELEAEGH